MQDRSPVTAVISGAGRQRKHRRVRGQAVVEFALILPVFLMLTLGVVDLARVFTAYVSLTNGVSNAALYAAHGGYARWCSAVSEIDCPPGGPALVDDPNNIAYQIQVETTGLTRSDIDFSAPQCTVTLTGTTGNCANVAVGIYSKVQIVATYEMTLITPLMTALVGTVHMAAATTAVTY